MRWEVARRGRPRLCYFACCVSYCGLAGSSPLVCGVRVPIGAGRSRDAAGPTFTATASHCGLAGSSPPSVEFESLSALRGRRYLHCVSADSHLECLACPASLVKPSEIWDSHWALVRVPLFWEVVRRDAVAFVKSNPKPACGFESPIVGSIPLGSGRSCVAAQSP